MAATNIICMDIYGSDSDEPGSASISDRDSERPNKISPTMIEDVNEDCTEDTPSPLRNKRHGVPVHRPKKGGGYGNRI